MNTLYFKLLFFTGYLQREIVEQITETVNQHDYNSN